MKGLIVIGVVSAAMLSGCVVAHNGQGGTLTDEEKAEMDENLDEAKGLLDSIYDEVKASLDEEMEDENWAVEIFDGYKQDENDKPLRITKIKAEDMESTDENERAAEEIEDVDGFAESLNVREWTKIEKLPEDLEPEYIFLVEQTATETVIQDNSGKFTEIARITTYKDCDHADVKVLGGIEYYEFMKIMPDDWFVSNYELPEEVSEFLRG